MWTGLVQLLLLLILYFVIAWKAPFPPIEEYGIQIGVQAVSQEVTSRTTESTKVASEQTERIPEESELQTESNEIEPIEPSESPNINEKQGDLPLNQEEKTEDVVAEEAQPTAASNESDGLEQETIKDEVEDTASDVQSEVTREVDERALYNTSNGSEGASLTMAGWGWDSPPKPNDSSDESGKIIYQVTIDRDGYILKINLMQSTVSPSVEAVYRRSVEQLTFSKTSGYKSAPTSSGTITFIIKTR